VLCARVLNSFFILLESGAYVTDYICGFITPKGYIIQIVPKNACSTGKNSTRQTLQSVKQAQLIPYFQSKMAVTGS